jgi:hypothetical protein
MVQVVALVTQMWTLWQHIRFELISFPFALLFYELNSTVVIYISQQRITIVKLPASGLQAVTEV